MALICKMTVVLVVLAVFGVHLSIATIPHRDHKARKVLAPARDKTSIKSDHETMIVGQVYCNGERAVGVRPFLGNPDEPEDLVEIFTTKEGGWYRLMTTSAIEDRNKTWLVVRHQCPQKNFVPREECRTPYYKMVVEIDLSAKRYDIQYNFDLGKQDNYTKSECLY